MVDPEKTSNEHPSFMGQQKSERVIMCSRQHPIILVPHLLGFIVATGLFAMVVHATQNLIEPGSLTYQALFLVLFGGYTYYFHRFFNKVFNYYLHTVILTNFRIIEVRKTVFFCNNKDTIDLHKIQDLKKGQDGFLCTLFDYGTLAIELSASHETKNIKMLPNPDKWFETMNNMKRSYIDHRRQRRAKDEKHAKPGKIHTHIQTTHHKMSEVF